MINEDNTIHRTRWNMMLIEDVKGIEFSSVIVFTNYLTKNEKYIAYTRAREMLFVYNIDINET